MITLPTWVIEFSVRRPRLSAPLTSDDYSFAEVGALDREGAAATFRQIAARRFPEAHIISISLGSGTGPA